MLVPFLSLAAIVAFATAVEPPRSSTPKFGNGTRLLSYNETTPSPNFGPSLMSVRWLEGGNDGEYISLGANGTLVVRHIATNEAATLYGGKAGLQDAERYWISSDRSIVLWSTNVNYQYRYSTSADYFITDLATDETTPLVEDQNQDIQHVELAPNGDVIAFVRGNNMFLHRDGRNDQITFDGGPDMFHGIPDWVYEEEIIRDDHAIWFSPDSKYLAFLSFNETGVGIYRTISFMDNQDVAPAYPDELDIRYPKVGTTNPTVQLHIVEVETLQLTEVAIESFGDDKPIIGEVAWVTDGHDGLLYRVFNRCQDQEKLVLVDPETGDSKAVRERDGSDGWLDNLRAIQFVGSVEGRDGNFYVDLSDKDGWTHIYLFPVIGGEPIQLTLGEWEVNTILKISRAEQVIYYASTEYHSTSRHLYSVSYNTLEKTPLVDDSVAGYWTASFSPNASYYILSYRGPDVPYQELYATNSTNNPIGTLRSNDELISILSDYKIPQVSYFELEHPNGFSLNVQEQLPANFDPAKKYPVLFTPYGGPGSAEVAQVFPSFGWNAYIASDPELEYITYTVDGRGTGRKGRAFRSVVAGQLGKLETEDQIWAAQELIKRNEFIDSERIGIWGWSYGAYLAAKVLEADSGVFSFGLMTAPVSDWRFYDTMYTERYMKTYDSNEAGYNESAVCKVDGFKHAAGGFAIMHGLADDNVHYQNTAALVDLLVGGGVSPQKMKVMPFTDSLHSISYHGAQEYLYKFLTERLWDEVKRDPGASIVHQWGKRTKRPW